MVLNFRYRIYPTKKQASLLETTLETCRFLYNYFLEERKTAYEKDKRNIRVFDQLNTLPKLKTTYPVLCSVHSQCLQNIGIRLELAFQAFFRRIKTGEKPGYPRFKAKGRYTSFTFPDYNCGKIIGDKIRISKIGDVDIEVHRPLKGIPKTTTITKSATGKFYATISCEVMTEALPTNEKVLGIDVGLKSFVTMTDGQESAKIDCPKFFVEEQNNLAKAQKRHEKWKTRKTHRVVSRIHERIANKRSNFSHQVSRKIVDNFGTIVMEDIDANSLLKKHWCNKQILDAAWAKFAGNVSYKAAYAGRRFVKVNPAYTSQTCHKCGARALNPLKLADRTFNCSCGHVEDRDVNAAHNILRLGLQSLA
jgi:putative transposase